MSSPVIAVTSAAGKTGQAVVRELRAKGFAVRAVVRRRDLRSEALARLGAEVVQADLFDAGSLSAALLGAHRAYYCPPLSPETGRMLDAFMVAAEAVRLEAVAAMTQWLASPSHPTRMTRDMWAVEDRLPALEGAAVTILNPGFFADNYLRVSMGMAAQLGLYANLVGRSRNAPPSNDDMARVVAGVLADPDRYAGRRMRITGPALIGVDEIVAALSTVLGRKVRALDTPEWLLNKVAAYRGEPRYDMAVFRHYLVDHREGAFAFGAPTDVVEEVTGRPAETFEETARGYLAHPQAQRTWTAFGSVLAQFVLAPLWRGYDHDAYETASGLEPPPGSRYAMQDEAWKARHARAQQAGAAASEPGPWLKRA
jgi:NAD(P)H dehydrogenase (quinone)